MILKVTREIYPIQNANVQFAQMTKESMKDELKHKLFEVLQPYIMEINEGNKITYTVEFAESIERVLKGSEPTNIRVLNIYGK